MPPFELRQVVQLTAGEEEEEEETPYVDRQQPKLRKTGVKWQL